MKSRVLLILIIAASISLLGIFLTQTFWLNKTLDVTERQFDHRASMMLNDIVEEIKTYSDTSKHISFHIEHNNLELFDVIDTILLDDLIRKYSLYHELDTSVSYALLVSETGEIIFSKNNYNPEYEKDAYKQCLSYVWQKQYIHLSVYFPNREKRIFARLFLWIFLSVIFIFTASAAFIAVVYNYYQQKKLAEIKNDFINNMTHELKTPLSTISVTSEMLIEAFRENKNERLSRYSKIIFDENHRMRKLVDKVLNISTMERGKISIEKEEFNAHDLIYKVVEVFCIEACTKEVLVDYNLSAQNPTIFADKMHIRNILNNMVDNAVKYSGTKPEIKIKTGNADDFFFISISDSGSGIPKEAIGKVFDKFYRVPSGNVHNVKGFGLGLYYVKTMIEAHGGKVEIQSIVNKGTTIIVYLPQKNVK